MSKHADMQKPLRRPLVRDLHVALALLLVMWLLAAPDNTAHASGAAGDACYDGTSTGALVLQPIDLSDPASGSVLVCDATETPTTPVGGACVAADTRFYSETDGCVTNNQFCTISAALGGGDGSYQNGICAAAAPAPSEPSVLEPPGGLTPSDQLQISSSAPPGFGGARQSTLCVNASPFVGGGLGVVSGTVLCYSGDAAMTNVYAYQTSPGSIGIGPVSTSAIGGTWSGLTAQDFWATRNITAQGSIVAQGGALLSGGDTQILSGSGQTGMQVTDAGVLIAAIGSGTDIGRDATVVIEPGSIVLTASTPTETAQLGMAPDASGNMRITQSVTGAASSGFTSVGADEILSQVTAGTSFSRTLLSAEQAQTLSTDGTSSSVLTLEPTEAELLTTDGTAGSVLTLEPTEATLLTTDGTSSSVLTLEPTEAELLTTDGTSSSVLTLEPTEATLLTTDGTAGSVLTLEPTEATLLTTDGTSNSRFTLEPTEATLLAEERALLQGGQLSDPGYSGVVTLGEYSGSGITSSGASMVGVYRNSPENIGSVTLGTADAGAVVTGVTSDPAAIRWVPPSTAPVPARATRSSSPDLPPAVAPPSTSRAPPWRPVRRPLRSPGP
jgi:hypothetical protein